jgi:hypothetical protein
MPIVPSGVGRVLITHFSAPGGIAPPCSLSRADARGLPLVRLKADTAHTVATPDRTDVVSAPVPGQATRSGQAISLWWVV